MTALFFKKLLSESGDKPIVSLSTSINTNSISSTVADASPAAWLGENYTSLFMLHPRISAVDCIGTRGRQFTRSTIFSLLVLGISANFALGIFAHFPWASLCTIFPLTPSLSPLFWGVPGGGRGVCGGVRSANQLKVTR